jgi:hypothetical protein
VVVDANVERVVSRLFAVEEPLPCVREKLYALTGSITPGKDCGDFAQAMMDLGATICTPRSPACGICPLAQCCEARRQGRQETFPVKSPKVARPHKHGIAYWLQHEDHVLLVRRPGKGLLGRNACSADRSLGEHRRARETAHPPHAQWSEAGAIDHVFTHFALNLRVYRAEADGATRASGGLSSEIEQAGPSYRLRQGRGAGARMIGFTGCTIDRADNLRASSSGPVIFAEPPIRVDPEALVGWADCPSPSHHYDAGWMQGFLGSAMGMMGRQSGEERQFDFTGAGTVLLQSSEHAVADPQLLQQIQGQVGVLGLPALQQLQATVQARIASQQQH